MYRYYRNNIKTNILNIFSEDIYDFFDIFILYLFMHLSAVDSNRLCWAAQTSCG